MAEKRCTFSPQFKVDAVMELLTGTKTASEICQERKITDKLLYHWKTELLEWLPSVFEGGTTKEEGAGPEVTSKEVPNHEARPG